MLVHIRGLSHCLAWPRWRAAFARLTRDAAMARVEETVVRSMGEVLADWAIFRPQMKQSNR
jgi:hypothetical protein